MPQSKLHLINQTKFNLIFDYKSREYFVPFEFNKTIEVENGSLLYVYPEGKPTTTDKLIIRWKKTPKLIAGLSWENCI